MCELILILVCSCLMGAMLTCGVFISLKILNFFDLTCNGSFALGGVTYLYLINNGISPYIAILACLMIGACCGMVTSLINTCLKLPKLLSGIISMSFLLTIANNLRIFNKINLESNVSYFEFTFLVILSVALLLCFYRFIVSEFGLQMRAIGGSNAFANTFSFDKRKLSLLGLGISNAFISIAGVLSVYCINKVDMNIESFGFLLALVAILITENNFKKANRSVYYEFLYAILFGGAYKFLIDFLGICFGCDMHYSSVITILVSITLICIYFFNKTSEKNTKDYFWGKKNIYY